MTPRFNHSAARHRTRGRLLANDLIDRLAIGLSALCVVHCIASVLLVAFLATAGGALLNPAFHEIGLLAAIGLAVFALGRGYLLHRRILPLVLGGIGIAAMALALALPHGWREAAITIVGVGFVATGHQLNRWHIKICQACHLMRSPKALLRRAAPTRSPSKPASRTG